MTTERLYEFTILATTLNFTKAANQLFTTQPVLSKHMKDLEKELNTTLFLRNTHEVTLTQSGKVLLTSSHKIIRETERLDNILRTKDLAVDGEVHVAFSEQTLCSPVLDFLKDFVHKYPNVLLHQIPLSRNLPPEILTEYDVVVSPCEYSNLPPYIHSSYLMSQSAIIVFPPRPNLIYGEYIALEDLADEALFVPFASESYGPFLRNAIMAEHLSHGHIHRVVVDSVRAGLLLVDQGRGVMLLPHHLQNLPYHNSRIVGVRNPECKFDIFIYLNSSNKNSAARLFYESAVNSFHA